MNLQDITIRNEVRPGDLGFVMHRHAVLYHREYGYGMSFEAYVGAGLLEFYHNYDEALDRVWICEHAGRMIGFLLLMHRENAAAQLRYLYIEPEYRGIGLGSKLMREYMEFLTSSGYARSYLWTTRDQMAAARLYLIHGFRLSAEKESTAFGKRLTEQRYDWTTAN